jgi:hypothetical protein
MGAAHVPDPVLLVVAAFSRHEAALAWAADRLAPVFGPLGLVSPTFAFDQTRYYEPAMGLELRKRFYVFRDLMPANCLPGVKRQTNEWEIELARSAAYEEQRPLNLDPGVLCLGKFLLATTKDQAHRVYLNDGIFAEVTLRYQDGAFHPLPWTYADYRQPAVLDFLKVARNYYRQRLREPV